MNFMLFLYSFVRKFKHDNSYDIFMMNNYLIMMSIFMTIYDNLKT